MGDLSLSQTLGGGQSTGSAKFGGGESGRGSGEYVLTLLVSLCSIWAISSRSFALRHDFVLNQLIIQSLEQWFPVGQTCKPWSKSYRNPILPSMWIDKLYAQINPKQIIRLEINFSLKQWMRGHPHSLRSPVALFSHQPPQQPCQCVCRSRQSTLL